MYVFPSASEDIGLNINSGAYGVSMSHYALLNFTKSNFRFTDTESIVEDLQNYAMNFESVVINQDNYNYQEPYTVSEHIFWDWLIKNGLSINTTEVSGNVFRETNYKSGLSSENRLVQCFGAIDAGNSLSTEFGMFNETYVTIPTSYGNGPVFFRNVNDNPNFNTGSEYISSTPGKLEGRSGSVSGYVDTTPEYTNDANHSYKANYAYEIIKDFPTIQNALRNMTPENFKSTININSYDDLNVDADNVLFNVDSNAYDMVNVSCEFNFNAILLYYSIYDLDDANKESIATNLFGIVFLDGGSAPTNDYLIAPLVKKKSYSGNGSENAHFGNSYSFRVNIKTLGVYDNTDAVIQDNTTTTDAYASNFNDVVYNLNRAISVMNTNVESTSRIQNQYMKMLDYYSEVKSMIGNIQTDSSNMVNTQLKNTQGELKKYVDERLTYAIEELNGPQDKISMLSGSDVVMDASGLFNIKTKDILFELSAVADTSVSRVYGSSLITDVKRLNLEVEQMKEDIAAISSQSSTPETYMTFSSAMPVESTSVVEEKEDINEVLKSLGILKCESILGAKKKFTEDMAYGLYLKKNASGNITSVVNHTESEDITEKCKSGILYSVEGLLYVFNGTTCKLLGEA